MIASTKEINVHEVISQVDPWVRGFRVEEPCCSRACSEPELRVGQDNRMLLICLPGAACERVDSANVQQSYRLGQFQKRLIRIAPAVFMGAFKIRWGCDP